MGKYQVGKNMDAPSNVCSRYYISALQHRSRAILLSCPSQRYCNVSVMDRGPSDRAIVCVKLTAIEDAVMYLRIKLLESDKESKSQNSGCFESSHRRFL